MLKIFFVLFPLFLFACKCSNPIGSTLDMNILQNDANSEGLFFCSSGKTLYGFDKVTYEQKVKISFNFIIIYGDKTSDGRILLSDQGGSGAWGSRVLVLDKNYKVVKEITTNSTPTEALVFDEHIFVGCASFVSADKFGLQIFNVNNYVNEKEFLVTDMLERHQYARNANDLFITATNYPSEVLNTTFYKLSLNTLDTTVLSSYSSSHFKGSPRLSFFDSLLVVYSPTYFDSLRIRCMNTHTGTELSSIRLDTISSIASGFGDPLLLPPCLIGNNIYFLLLEGIYPSKRAKLITLSFPQLQFVSVTDQQYDNRMIAFDYYYLNDSTMVIYSQDNGMNIISFPSGALLKHTSL